MKKVLYKQCFLNRYDIEKDCIHATTRWLPSQFAHVDNVVKLKENGEWTDGWVVIEVGPHSCTDEQIDFYRSSY